MSLQATPRHGVAKWRRRESNPQERCGTALENETISVGQDGLAADWQRIGRHSENGFEGEVDAIPSLRKVAESWLYLPQSTRQVIVALVQATLK